MWSLTEVEKEAARNLLWLEGRRDEGWEPGSFTYWLLGSLQRADQWNTSKILTSWPEFHKPYVIATTRGLDELVLAVNR